MDMLRLTLQTTSDGVMLDKDLFKKCVQSNIVLLTQAFRRKFVIPDFMSFTSHIDELFESAKKQSGGKVADYIPQLAKFSPDLWGVSVCTVDGQRHSIGDTKVPFCLQSCVKPLKYAIAVNDLGTEYVHRYVGKEPSGLRFNKLFLNEDDKPHNPMVNAGAIVVTSLIKQGVNNAEKFDYVMQFLNKMAGNEYVGFSNATFQSERESGDRNFAIGYYLKEKKCFPEGTDMVGILDFYFQPPQFWMLLRKTKMEHNYCFSFMSKFGFAMLCSIEVTCESASVMAATLANGGFCPITGERVLSPEAVRNTLSLMHSCGMYDFSGQFAFHVGLPAKSGVAGGILLVVPNVMGMMCWSPPLDKMGNSVKGIHFCHDLVSLCNFHNYDNLRHFAKKLDPRREGGDQRVKSVINLLFAAYTGDVSALRRFALSAMDMEQRDYDSRTALHVAAAEGKPPPRPLALLFCFFLFSRWNLSFILSAGVCLCCFGYRSRRSRQIPAGSVQGEPVPQGQVRTPPADAGPQLGAPLSRAEPPCGDPLQPPWRPEAAGRAPRPHPVPPEAPLRGTAGLRVGPPARGKPGSVLGKNQAPGPGGALTSRDRP
uniref:glutaminase n=1 Tax=Canis lupus familiaris TaxID=9615 RepID=A0A8C0SLS2_CANLF